MQKSTFTKKELGCIKAGTFVTLAWNDAPDEVVLLIEKIDIKKKGDISLRYLTWTDSSGKFGTASHAIHSQIVGIGEWIKFPEPVRNKA